MPGRCIACRANAELYRSLQIRLMLYAQMHIHASTKCTPCMQVRHSMHAHAGLIHENVIHTFIYHTCVSKIDIRYAMMPVRQGRGRKATQSLRTAKQRQLHCIG